THIAAEPRRGGAIDDPAAGDEDVEVGSLPAEQGDASQENERDGHEDSRTRHGAHGSAVGFTGRRSMGPWVHGEAARICPMDPCTHASMDLRLIYPPRHAY